MKRNVVALFGVLLCIIFTACSASVEPSEAIKKVSFLAEENGVAYYDVYLNADVDWSELSDSNQQEIAIYAINKCCEEADALESVSCMVMGFDTDGQNAFSWGGVDGSEEIRFYDDGVYNYNYIIEDGDLN